MERVTGWVVARQYRWFETYRKALQPTGCRAFAWKLAPRSVRFANHSVRGAAGQRARGTALLAVGILYAAPRQSPDPDRADADIAATLPRGARPGPRYTGTPSTVATSPLLFPAMPTASALRRTRRSSTPLFGTSTFYRVTAVDVHSNESPNPPVVTGAGHRHSRAPHGTPCSIRSARRRARGHPLCHRHPT